MIDERISPNFYLSELWHSETATRLKINNYPDAVALAGLRNFAGPGIQRVRDLLCVPVLISSGYRGPALNRHVGGSATSQHMSGLAIDFTAPAFGPPRKVAERLLDYASTIKFDQLILEFDRWVHCSWSSKPRGQVLTINHQGTKNGLA